MKKQFIIIAAIFGAFGVALGAFGAHGLSSVFEANGREATFITGTRYHMYHTLALLMVAWLSEQIPAQWAKRAGYLFIAGILLFSGSLYILSIFDLSFMGAVAPFGGIALILGWVCIAIGAWQQKSL